MNHFLLALRMQASNAEACNHFRHAHPHACSLDADSRAALKTVKKLHEPHALQCAV
jgi:hypothetical protein